MFPREPPCCVGLWCASFTSIIICLSFSHSFPLPLSLGKPVMIITEYMENGSLDAFLRVSHAFLSVHMCACAWVCMCVSVWVCECVSVWYDCSRLIPSYLCNVIHQNYKRLFANIRPNLDRLTVFLTRRLAEVSFPGINYTYSRCLRTWFSKYTYLTNYLTNTKTMKEQGKRKRKVVLSWSQPYLKNIFKCLNVSVTITL